MSRNIDMASALKWFLKSKGIKMTFVSEKTGFSIDCISKTLRKKRKFSANEMMSILQGYSASLLISQ